MVPERLLDRVERVLPGEPLDGGDFRPVRLHREDGAGLHRLPVHEDGAGAALRGVAADVRPGQPQPVAQQVAEEEARLHFVFGGLAVDGDADAVVHARTPPARRSGRTPALPAARPASVPVAPAPAQPAPRPQFAEPLAEPRYGGRFVVRLAPGVAGSPVGTGDAGGNPAGTARVAPAPPPAATPRPDRRPVPTAARRIRPPPRHRGTLPPLPHTPRRGAAATRARTGSGTAPGSPVGPPGGHRCHSRRSTTPSPVSRVSRHPSSPYGASGMGCDPCR